MDSGTSGSMQSSSGGGGGGGDDDLVDSRSESISNFVLHSSSSGGGGPTSLPLSQPPQHQPPPTSSLFDTLSYLESFARSPLSSSSNPPSFVDTPWSSRPLHHLSPLDPGCTADITGLIAPPSSSSQVSAPPGMMMTTSINMARQFSMNAAQPAPDPPPPSRSSKKRSRASRRAPTTVLTTDTSNFRAMVQEFTGIPAAPFAAAASSSSPFARSRLDLFHSAGSSSRDPSSASVPPYLLRPFAQKVQAPTFGSMISATTSTTNNSASNNNISATTSSLNANNTNTSISMTTSTTCTNSTPMISSYHELGLNMQNSSLLGFQSLLASPKYNLPVFAAKSHQINSDYGMHHLANVNMNPNLVGSEGMHAGWPEGAAAEAGGGDQAQLRSTAANYGGLQRGSSCKINFSSSTSSDFHAEKGSTETAPGAARPGEGMLDSWICSSD